MAGKQLQSWFNHATPQPSWKGVIHLKLLVGGVTLVSGEELVSAIAAQQDGHSLFARQQRTVISSDGGRVGKRLVIVGNKFFDRLQSVVGVQKFLEVAGPETLRRNAGKANLAVAGIAEINGKCVYWRVALVHK